MRREDIREIIEQTRNTLEFHHSLGLDSILRTREIEEFLAARKKADKPDLAAPKQTKGHRKTHAEVSSVAALTADNNNDTLDFIRSESEKCIRCGLHSTRKRIVFDGGTVSSRAADQKASLFIVCDWPNKEDEEAGAAISGEPGKLLTKMLAAINLRPAEAYITNIIKCVPPESESPGADEARACLPFLQRQIAVVRPRVICVMGNLAAGIMLETDNEIIRIRGRFHDFQGIPVMATFHPAFLIKYPDMKRAAWNDLQMIQRKLK